MYIEFNYTYIYIYAHIDIHKGSRRAPTCALKHALCAGSPEMGVDV